MSKKDTRKEDVNQVTEPFVCGVVMFDHPQDMTTGTAFLPNTAAQRIRSINDLRNDVIWISNLSIYEQRIKNHPAVRNSFFFKIGLNEIVQDIGIQSSYDGQMQPEDAQKLAEIFTRALTIAARSYNWASKEERVRMTDEIIFSSSLRKALPASPVPDARWRDSLIDVFTHSYQESSSPSWGYANYIPDSFYITLRFNYVNYVYQLLNSPVPKGRKWLNLNEGAVRLLDNPLEFCLQMDKPCFVRATVEWGNAQSNIAALSAYGQAGKKKNPMRLWMSLPELKWLSNFATVNINYIWIDESGYTSLPEGALMPSLLAEHPESQLSYTAHLMAFNHYQALTAQVWSRKTRSTRASLWGAWIKALDRAYMFSVALKAMNNGFHVDRYGDGALRLNVPRNELDKLIAFKHEVGFMYPDLSIFTRENEN